MISYINECVSCGLPCLGNLCPNKNVKHYICDCCGEEMDDGELFEYEFGSEQLCIECIRGRLKVVE